MATTEREKPSKKGKNRAKEERDHLKDLAKGKGDALGAARKQLRTAAKVAGITVVVIWLVAISLFSGLKSPIPLYVATGLTVAMGVAALLIRRNLGRSEELGAMLSQSGDLSAEERADRIAKLEERVQKGEAAAIIAKAQLEMQDSPKDALVTLEKIDLEKAQKMVGAQVRAMRSMIHLNLGDVGAARELAEQIDLQKAADLKMRANLAGVVAEAWARSGNPIEANQLLDKYDPNDKDFEEMKVQLYRARVFACVHQNDLKGMRRALKSLEEISPQLMAAFLGQKRIHPLLQQEAKKRLEKSGMMPKQRIMARR
jgi:hypothetical protein